MLLRNSARPFFRSSRNDPGISTPRKNFEKMSTWLLFLPARPAAAAEPCPYKRRKFGGSKVMKRAEALAAGRTRQN